ncbi:MAG: carbohydrate ABC transporter permease [Lachnospirales bacterium]
MFKRIGIKDITFELLVITIMLVICLVIAYPLYFVLIASITDPDIVNRGGFLLLPETLYLEGYKKILNYSPLWLGYKNSIVYMIAGTAINLLITIPAGYTLSRKDLPWRKGFMLLFIFTMVFNGGLVPTYLIVSGLGIRDTIWAMVLPNAMSVYNLIITKTFFETNLPDEILEAAKIDGCSDFKFFITIALPLSKVIIAVIGLFYAVGHWNSYFQAMIYLNKSELFPLQIVLRNLLIMNEAQGGIINDPMAMASKMKLAEQLKYGIIIVSSLPLLLIYPFIQKYFTQGVLIGSVKG